jgi:deoxyribose-phosphate aldolase
LSAQDDDVERLVTVIAERVQARLGAGGPALRLLKDTPCEAEPGPDCAECGLCVVRRPWSVRAVQEAGATRVAAAVGAGQVPSDIAGLIDHTLLKPEVTRDDIRKLCDEAKRYHFASVCVNSTWVGMCKALLGGSGVMVCAVVGFPLGAMAPTSKAFEAREAVRAGANEIDMVVNIGALKSRDYETVFEDICRVVKAAHPAKVKVILETGGLSLEEKIVGCTLSKLAGAHFVKTSTGFGPGGATVEDVTLMRKIVGADMGVKASGGVRTREDVEKMALAGANRIGASASVAIVTGATGDKGDKKQARVGGY